MEGLTKTVRQELIRMVPASILNEISCFVFYDNHPQDVKRLDITVCTRSGDIKEYFQRQLISSLNIKTTSAPEEIIILRNKDSELKYVVHVKDKLYMLSSRDNLVLDTEITDVAKFSIHDLSCAGQPYLQVTIKDDAVPVVYDENLSAGTINNSNNIREKPNVHPLPVLNKLKSKYTEVKFNVKANEKMISNYASMRQEATLKYVRNIPSTSATGSIVGSLNLASQTPWIKVCNAKLVVALMVLNQYTESVQDVKIFLNAATGCSQNHVTKLFEEAEVHPFWKQLPTQQIIPNQKTCVVAVIDLEEIRLNTTHRISLSGALYYKISENSHMIPFEELDIPSVETLGDEFDALSSSECDKMTLLAILSASEKTDLKIRMMNIDEVDIMELFMKYLEMERIGPDMIVYKKSPYHALNGILIHFREWVTERVVITSVFTRTKRQALTLLHFINDAVPANIIITPTSFIVIAKDEQNHTLSDPQPVIPQKDYRGYAESIINRTQLMLEYFDASMVKMSETGIPRVLSLIGNEMDMYACGRDDYQEFRRKMIEEGDKGASSLLNDKTSSSEEVVSEDFVEMMDVEQ